MFASLTVGDVTFQPCLLQYTVVSIQREKKQYRKQPCAPEVQRGNSRRSAEFGWISGFSGSLWRQTFVLSFMRCATMEGCFCSTWVIAGTTWAAFISCQSLRGGGDPWVVSNWKWSHAPLSSSSQRGNEGWREKKIPWEERGGVVVCASAHS